MTDIAHSENPYKPHLAEVKEIRLEVPGERSVKTFKVEFIDEEVKSNFNQRPGQCAMLGILGRGESFISISSPSTWKGYLEFSVLQYVTGRVTPELHKLEAGDIVTVRGPYGNGFPVDDWKGKNLFFIGGGIGQAPLRSVYMYTLDPEKRKDYGQIDIIYGARTSKDLVFKKELEELEAREDVNVHLSVDVEEDGWSRFVGFVPSNVEKIAPSPENAIALTCGPPIMIKFVIQNLEKLGFTADK
ncbi:MAG: FAD/NAD(P)-binding protein, partial [Thermoplasmata archaeon]|nr:FAD/NAD(P)-binding protein [Thermoplasmata archaeon]